MAHAAPQEELPPPTPYDAMSSIGRTLPSLTSPACLCASLCLSLCVWLLAHLVLVLVVVCDDGVMAGPSRLWSFLIRKDYSQEVALGSVEQCGMTGTGWTVELWVKVRAKP